MVVFLTSSPTGPLDRSRVVEGFDVKNQFRENLKKYWDRPARCLMIAASPEDIDSNHEMQAFFAHALEISGLPVEVMDIWDCRTTDFSKGTLHSYDVILLGGGHVPTQNAFFHSIGLAKKMRDFEGLVIGISAGTMNSAQIVYAQPELPGEALDPGYRKFLKGLGLTTTNILPHYQMVKDWMLDGMRLYEDITYGDSHGHEFVVLVDGSYLLIENGIETIWGEAYLITEGLCHKICGEDEICRL